MIIKIRIAHWRFTFTLAPVTDVIGVNSTLPEGDHITMWDFDGLTQHEVEGHLRQVQQLFILPNIYIFQTKAPDHFIAYCFKAMPWRDSVMIVASTPGVDPYFFKYGVYREHWTLRVTPKEGRKPRLIKVLFSDQLEDASISELDSWVKDEKTMPSSPSRSVRHPFLYSLQPRQLIAWSKEASAYNMRQSLTEHQYGSGN